MVVCIYYPTLGRLRHEDGELEARTSYIVGPCVKKQTGAKSTFKRHRQNYLLLGIALPLDTVVQLISST